MKKTNTQTGEKRSSGILLPVFSLPSEYDMGTFGKEARQFADWLAEAGQSFWQVLPLGPVNASNSPYDPVSCFAINPYYIDLEQLMGQGLIGAEDLKNFQAEHAFRRKASEAGGEKAERNNYKLTWVLKEPLLRKAFASWQVADSRGSGAFRGDIKRSGKRLREFYRLNDYWLGDAAMYTALSQWFREEKWRKWPEDIQYRKPEAMAYYRDYLKKDIEFYGWLQYEASRQWLALKNYCHDKGIELIGDVPMYTAINSADCWSHPEIFQLDSKMHRTGGAGVPPDAYNQDGQFWGNPLYEWHGKRKETWTWWAERVRMAFTMYDVVRLDHFQGFEQYFSIPIESADAGQGQWRKGPGIDFFRYLERGFGIENGQDIPFIAEDLGTITDDVRKLLAETGYPGMKVLQFAFESDENNPYLPDNYDDSHCIVYTGTHDNNTTRGWFAGLEDHKKTFVENVLRRHLTTETYYCPAFLTEDNIAPAMVALAEGSKAATCIIPMQDVLNLDSSARINIPAVPEGNWNWQLPQGIFGEEGCSSVRISDRRGTEILNQEAERLRRAAVHMKWLAGQTGRL